MRVLKRFETTKQLADLVIQHLEETEDSFTRVCTQKGTKELETEYARGRIETCRKLLDLITFDPSTVEEVAPE